MRLTLSQHDRSRYLSGGKDIRDLSRQNRGVIQILGLRQDIIDADVVTFEKV